MRQNLSFAFILSCVNITLALSIYQEPSSDAPIVDALNLEHELHIKSSDWVQVTDQESGKEGWIQLSQLRNQAGSSGNWKISFDGTSQEIHYKPVSEDEAIQKIKSIHESHHKIMTEFENLWSKMH
jgi:hypothetical protein